MPSRRLVTKDRRYIVVPKDIDADQNVVVRSTAIVRGAGVRTRAGSEARDSVDDNITINRVLRDLVLPAPALSGPGRIREGQTALFFADEVPTVSVNDNPNLQFSHGAGAKIRRRDSLGRINWLVRGSCYSEGDTLFFRQRGAIRGVDVRDGGAGFATPPVVRFEAPSAGGQPATAVARITSGNLITQIDIDNGGSGYSIPPVIEIDPPSAETTAIVEAQVNDRGELTGFTNLQGGSGYIEDHDNLIVTIADPPPGQRANADAVLTEGVLTSINITQAGMGYLSPPTVVIEASAAGVQALATAVVEGGVVTRIDITDGASGYTSPPAVFIDPPSFFAEAQVIVHDGAVIGLIITNPGYGYPAPPVVTISPPNSQATATCDITLGRVTSIFINNPGHGYDANNPPGIRFVGDGNGAIARARINTVTDIEVTFPGSGYDPFNPPRVSVGGGNVGVQASVTGVDFGASYTLTGNNIDEIGALQDNIPYPTDMNAAVSGGDYDAKSQGWALLSGGGSFIVSNGPAALYQSVDVPVNTSVSVQYSLTARGTGAAGVRGQVTAGAQTVRRNINLIVEDHVDAVAPTFDYTDIISVDVDAGETADILVTPHDDTGRYDRLTHGWRVISVGVTSAQATATLSANGGIIEGITVDNGGAGYTSPPTVRVVGTGSGAEATAILSATGSVMAVMVTAGGSGYVGVPTIQFVVDDQGSFDDATALSISYTPPAGGGLITLEQQIVAHGDGDNADINTVDTATIREDFVAFKSPFWDDPIGEAITLALGREFSLTVPPARTGYPYGITYVATRLPAGLEFDPATLEISGTPTEFVDGDIVITALNAHSSSIWTASYITLRPPVFADPIGDSVPATGNPFVPITVPVATGFPTPTYAVEGSLPAGVRFDPVNRRITGTFALGSSGTVTIRASNSVGFADWQFSYGNFAPMFLVNMGDPIVSDDFGQITVPEALGFPIPTYAVVGALPDGLEFDRVTREISGYPLRAAAGSGTIIIRATNSEGSDDWTVDYRFIGDAIGATNGGGTGLREERAIASHGGELYVIGRDHTTLAYTLRQLGPSPRDVGPNTMSRLASHDDVLYGIGRDNNLRALYTIDTTTGAATRVAFSSFGSVELYGLTSHNDVLYMLAGSNVNRDIYEINTTTGAATELGNINFGIRESRPVALASHGGRIFVIGQDTDAIYIVDPTTLVATRVGPYISPAVIPETSPEAMTSHEGSLYLLGEAVANVWILDVPTAPEFANDTGTPLSGDIGSAISPVTVPQAASIEVTYAVVGSLPTGLSFDPATRVLSGTPTVVGSGTITIRATNFIGSDDWTVAYDFVLGVPVFADDTGDTITDSFTSVAIPMASGVPTYAVVGSLPPGLSFNPTTRILSGMPTRVGSGTITIRATNSAGSDDWTAAYAITGAPAFVQDTGPTLVYAVSQAIAPITVPAAQAIITPVAYAVVGSLPAGLSFNPTTRVISGTPTAMTGSGTITVWATNSAGSDGWMLAYRSGVLGAASRVGSAAAFGVSETNPGSLASHANALYMVGNTNDALYTVDPITGAATQVGSATRFGANIQRVAALASHGGVLYAIGFGSSSSISALYTLNTTTGVATRVSTSNPYGAGERNPSGMASHNNVLYMIGRTNDALYTIDPTTGAATRVGTAVEFGVEERVPTALTSHDGSLYMLGEGTDALYILDTATGEATRVGTGARFGVNEHLPSGLASHDSVLYMTGTFNDALYTLNVFPAAPEFAEDMGDAITNDFGQVIVPAASGIPGPTYAVVGSLPDGLVFNPATRQISGTATTTESGTITIRATNFIGSDDWTVAYSFVAPSAPMFVDNTGDPITDTFGSLVVPAAVGIPAATYAVVGSLPAGLQFNPNDRFLSGVPTAVASGTITIRATNALGSDDWTVAYNFAGIPVFTNDIGTPVNLPVGGGTGIVVPRARAFITPVTYSVVGSLPAGVRFLPAVRVLEFSPRAVDSGTITVRATNSAGSDDWMVDYAFSGAPVLPQGTGTAIADGFGSVTVPEATGIAVTYAVVGNLPAGLSFNPTTRVISGLPTAVASGTITIRASNRSGSDDWMVDYAFTGVPAFSEASGRAIHYNVGRAITQIIVPAASGVPAPTYEVVGNLPAGFSFNPTTRVLSGTPTAATGSGTIAIRATNSLGSDHWTVTYQAIAIGVATRVGTAIGFGVNENAGGLASHSNVLYMVGTSADALYTVNPTTGVATRVGSADKFGAGIGVPNGLTSHGGSLYMVDTTTEALYTVDPATGIATRAGTATLFGLGVSNFVPTGLASHGGSLYMVDATNHDLYTVDPATGIATRVGRADNFGINGLDPQGLASHNNVLYMTEGINNALFSLNTTTGVATQVGSALGFGHDLRSGALASHGDSLLMAGSELYVLTV